MFGSSILVWSRADCEEEKRDERHAERTGGREEDEDTRSRGVQLRWQRIGFFAT